MLAINRILAVILRNYAYLSRSPLQLVELVLGPLMGVIVWTFTVGFLKDSASHSEATASVIQGLVTCFVLWELVVRGQAYLVRCLMEEVLSRNLGYLLITPIRELELAIAHIIVSVLLGLFSMTPAIFYLISQSYIALSSVSVIVLAATSVTVFGWSLGFLVSAAVFKFGRPAEILSSLLVLGLAPISCVFYPRDQLPPSLALIAKYLPTANSFEAIRAVLSGSDAQGTMLKPICVSLAALVFSGVIYVRACRGFRLSGKAIQQ